MDNTTVVIETPKGKGLKYNYDSATGQFTLTKVLPAGLVFPFDFGFIPGTLGEDGDPLDVVVISEIETFTGCTIECRIIGALKAKQKEKNSVVFRNDRYLAIPLVSNLYHHVKTLNQLPKEILAQLEAFFVNYNKQAQKHFEPEGWLSAKQSISAIEQNRKQHVLQDTLVQLFLPLYNKLGKPFSKQHFDEVKGELTNTFGGGTFYFRSPVSGTWKPDQKIIKDELLVAEIMTNQKAIPLLRRYKASLEKRFKQDEIVMRLLSLRLL